MLMALCHRALLGLHTHTNTTMHTHAYKRSHSRSHIRHTFGHDFLNIVRRHGAQVRRAFVVDWHVVLPEQHLVGACVCWGGEREGGARAHCIPSGLDRSQRPSLRLCVCMHNFSLSQIFLPFLRPPCRNRTIARSLPHTTSPKPDTSSDTALNLYFCATTPNTHTHTQTHKSPQVSSSLLHSKNHLVQALSTPLILPSFFLTGRTRPKSLDWPPVKAGQCAETPCNPSSALALGTHGLATGDCLCPALPPLCVCVRA